MIKILIGVLLILSLSVPAEALELSAPEVPQSGLRNMPQNTESFSDGLPELLQTALKLFCPELEEALKICYGILISVMLFSLLPILAEKTANAISVAGTVSIAAAMFHRTNAMIASASTTVREICEYGKLLCPVLTTALAAQGGISSSAALYAGTTVFLTLLHFLVSRLIVPMVYLFLSFSAAHCALGEEVMKKFSDAVKSLLHWTLKIILIVFTTYMSVTGVVSGTTDAATLKAAKVTVSSVVPVVGGILSDASESLLVSMGIVKNAAGIYGILAVMAVFLGPFIKIGTQYLLLKITAIICSLFAEKHLSALVEDFSSAMGMLLAMVSSGCIMVLISTVCFLKGLG